MNTVTALRPAGSPAINWWNDEKMVALVKRTAAKDCDADEFNQFVAVCRDLGLSPLRKQIYAFVFNKDDATKRNMALVVGIDGGRSIAARSGNYRPDNNPPVWATDGKAVNALTNPHGVISCTVGVYHRPTRNDAFERITATVFWDEFAPILRSADPDAFEWVDTGEVFPAGHKKAGQTKRAKQLRAGASADVTERLDPRKEQWTRSGRHKIALCAEMQALRRGWPEDMSRVYVEEETDRAAAVIDGDYTDLTPSEMVVKADTDARVERLGGPALFAVFDLVGGALERVPHGQFADRMVAVTEHMAPADVATLVERNRVALQEFWAHSKNDSLALKKILEQRSGDAGGSQAHGSAPAKAAPPQQGDPDKGGAAKAGPVQYELAKLDGVLAERHRDNLIRDIATLETPGDLLGWSKEAEAQIARLPDAMADTVRAEFNARQNTVQGMHR